MVEDVVSIKPLVRQREVDLILLFNILSNVIVNVVPVESILLERVEQLDFELLIGC